MALDMFINMGANIKGESADKARGAKGDIDVLAWSWGMSQSGTTHMGGGGGAGKANFQDLSFTKFVDAASNGARRRACCMRATRAHRSARCGARTRRSSML